MKGSIACLVCGGSFATDQRRKHEATGKHQRAAAAVHIDKEQKGDSTVRSPQDTRPVPDPEVIEKHVAELNETRSYTVEGDGSLTPFSGDHAVLIEDASTSEALLRDPVSAPAKPVAFPATADVLAALEKQVKARAADVRWSEKHTDTDSAEKLAKRRAKLAEAEAALAAALGPAETN